MTPLVLASSPKAMALAHRIARIWPGVAPAGPEDFATLARAAFAAGRPIVGVCGAELLIRTLAPLLAMESASAPVLAVTADGTMIVPLLGDDALARRIGSALCATVAAGAGEPRLLVGIGCERGVSADEITGTVSETLAGAGLAATSVALLCSIDTKRDDVALKEAALRFGLPLRLFDAATLEAETPRLANPSELVFRAVGCHGVAEAAALAAAGTAARLIVPKRRTGRVTCAVALDLAS